jgi:hypothetical protein
MKKSIKPQPGQPASVLRSELRISTRERIDIHLTTTFNTGAFTSLLYIRKSHTNLKKQNCLVASH